MVSTVQSVDLYLRLNNGDSCALMGWNLHAQPMRASATDRGKAVLMLCLATPWK
jgi:hypothetical protein